MAPVSQPTWPRLAGQVGNDVGWVRIAFFKVADDGSGDLLRVGFQSSRTALDQQDVFHFCFLSFCFSAASFISESLVNKKRTLKVGVLGPAAYGAPRCESRPRAMRQGLCVPSECRARVHGHAERPNRA